MNQKKWGGRNSTEAYWGKKCAKRVPRVNKCAPWCGFEYIRSTRWLICDLAAWYSIYARIQIHDRTQEWRADGLPFDIPAGAGPNWGSDGGGYSRAVDDQQQPQVKGEGESAVEAKVVDATKVQLLLGRRVEAKKRRDFGRADAIRLHVSACCLWQGAALLL